MAHNQQVCCLIVIKIFNLEVCYAKAFKRLLNPSDEDKEEVSGCCTLGFTKEI